MSIVQISRIQVRRGQTTITGVPQLASGELGWSVDQQQLYIGNGTVSDGAPAVGNTRILTEHDANIFALTTPNYIYLNTESGPSVQTGPASNPNIIRFMQNKLDDIVNLRDFGATGNGAVADTGAIQRAVLHASSTGKILNFPEGTYLVTATIYLPPRTEIRGSGINKTTLVATTTATIFQTVGRDINGSIVLDPNGAVSTPRDIVIDKIGFVSSLTNAAAIIKFNSVLDGVISSCGFRGNLSQVSTSTHASAIEILGSGLLTCDGISIRNSIFQSLGSALISNYDVKRVEISNNKFKDIDAGLVFMKNPVAGNIIGPDAVVIHDNTFYNINNQAVFDGSTGTNHSSVKSYNNSYTRVGVGYNNIQGDLVQVTEVLKFSNFDNISINDDFSRLYSINTGSVSAFSTIVPIINGPVSFTTQLIKPITISSAGTYNVFAWPTNVYTASGVTCPGQSISINYTFAASNTLREGSVDVVVNANRSTINDIFSYTDANDGGLTFALNQSRNDVTVITVTASVTGTLTYSINIRQ